MLAAAVQYDAVLVNDDLDLARDQLTALAKTLLWLGNQAEAARVAARCVETTVDATTQMRDRRR